MLHLVPQFHCSCCKPQLTGRLLGGQAECRSSTELVHQKLSPVSAAVLLLSSVPPCLWERADVVIHLYSISWLSAK